MAATESGIDNTWRKLEEILLGAKHTGSVQPLAIPHACSIWQDLQAIAGRRMLIRRPGLQLRVISSVEHIMRLVLSPPSACGCNASVRCIHHHKADSTKSLLKTDTCSASTA